MIIPAYNEDDILRELLDDYKSVQRKAKKIAMAELEKMARYGKQEKKTELSHYFRSKNGNKWHLTIVCRTGKKKEWIHRQHCIVELGNGLRDVFFLRGTRFGPPYYVQIHTHAIQRMRERFCPKEGSELDTNPDVMLDKVCFHPSEQGVFQYLTPPQLAKKIEREKRGSKVGGLCITRAANFIGYRTDKGNYEFLTFLAVKQMINNKKENLHFYLRTFYAYLNPKELASIGANLNMYTLDQVFTAIAAKYPGIEPYIKHAEGLYILYL